MDDHLVNRPMLEVELADAVIRILDMAGGLGLDVAGAIAEKLNYNDSRADHKPENRAKDGSLGVIAIDSIFTPIKNVKYTIENTRVEQRTDFEKLIMEIHTDGTIHPEEAVKEASRILIQHLMIITDENISLDTKREEKEHLVDEETLQLRKILNTPLEDLELSVRAFNCLKAAKINSLSELVHYTQEELMKFRNFGQKSLSEIEQMLIDRGLSFGMDLNRLNLRD
jgi:DNA-directed RNA polymerase subunit alpha